MDPSGLDSGTLRKINDTAALAPILAPGELSPSDGLSPKERLEFWATPVRRLAAQRTVCNVTMGRWLIAAKTDFKRHKLHGHFTCLVETTGWSMDTAQKWMKLAEKLVLLDTATSRCLPPAWTTLHQICRLEPENIKKFVEDGIIHPELTFEAAEDLVREVRMSNSNGQDHGSDEGCGGDHDTGKDHDLDEGRSGNHGTHQGARPDGDEDHDRELNADLENDGHCESVDGADHGGVQSDDCDEEHAERPAASAPVGSQVRINELIHEVRLRDIRICGLESEIADLKTAAAEAHQQGADLVAAWNNGTDAELAAGLAVIGSTAVFRVMPDWENEIVRRITDRPQGRPVSHSSLSTALRTALAHLAAAAAPGANVQAEEFAALVALRTIARLSPDYHALTVTIQKDRASQRQRHAA